MCRGSFLVAWFLDFITEHPEIAAAMINAGALFIVAVGVTWYLNRKQTDWQHEKVIEQKKWDIKFSLFCDILDRVTRLIPHVTHMRFNFRENLREFLIPVDYHMEVKESENSPDSDDVDLWAEQHTHYRNLMNDIAQISAKAKLIYKDQSVHASIKYISRMFALDRVLTYVSDKEMKEAHNEVMAELEKTLGMMDKEMTK